MNSRVVAALLLVSGLAACSIDVPAPKAVVPPPSAPDAGSEALAAWGRVLSTRVDAEGRIDFAGLVRNGADLNAYVAWVAAVSPESRPAAFPSTEAKLLPMPRPARNTARISEKVYVVAPNNSDSVRVQRTSAASAVMPDEARMRYTTHLSRGCAIATA